MKKLFAFFGVVFLLQLQKLKACTCLVWYSTKEAFTKAAVVLSGTVTKIEYIRIVDTSETASGAKGKEMSRAFNVPAPGAGGEEIRRAFTDMKATIKIDFIYKGEISDSTFIVYTGTGDDCHSDFSIGMRYIVYAENDDVYYSGMKVENSKKGTPLYTTNDCINTAKYNNEEDAALRKISAEAKNTHNPPLHKKSKS